VAGKHVLIEKPLAHKKEEADELIALAERKGLMLTVGLFAASIRASPSSARRSRMARSASR